MSYLNGKTKGNLKSSRELTIGDFHLTEDPPVKDHEGNLCYWLWPHVDVYEIFDINEDVQYINSCVQISADFSGVGKLYVALFKDDDEDDCSAHDYAYEMSGREKAVFLALVLEQEPRTKSNLKGSRELTAGDFYLGGNPADENAEGGWFYFLSTAGNMDEIFGTNVETSANDDYINVYANISADYSHIEDQLEITLWKGNGETEEYSYDLSEREKNIILAMILEYEVSRLTKRLNEVKGAAGL